MQGITTVLAHSPLYVGGTTFCPTFCKWVVQKKMWGDLESSCHKYLPGGLAVFLVKKYLVK